MKIKKQGTGEIVDDFITKDMPDTSTIEDLAKGNFIHTPSVMYRYDPLVSTTIAKMGILGVGDYLSHMLYACNGKIMKLPDAMAIYRYGVGVWSSSIQSDNSKELQWLVACSKLLPCIDNLMAKTNLDRQISSCQKVIIDYLTQLSSVRQSHAYRLGKALLRPFSWIKRKF